MDTQTTALPTGFALGAYEIEARVGAGGMGAVYRARDTRLGRRVAVKVIQAANALTEARRQRFAREARVLSGLSHPHICTVYDVGRQGEVDYLVMEYVEGRTLADLIASGPLATREAVRLGAQMAEALASAHAKGVVHRDLKPANVIVTTAGAKLLDFGLARLVAPESADDATSTLASEDLLTAEGVVVGTAPYLSPEQALGLPVDTRSDIFSFGAVLYEMLTGNRAFERPSRVETVAAVLNEDPAPLEEAAPRIPPDLARLVERCLRKDRSRRLSSMSDIALALHELPMDLDSRASKPTAVAPPGRRRPSRMLGGAVVGVVVVALAAAISLRRYSPDAPASRRAGSIRIAPLTTERGIQRDPSLSPDGRQVAYSWNGPDEGNFDIYVKTTAPGPPLRVTRDPAEELAPAWSPDGGSIAFLRALGANRYAIVLVPALGGPERTVGEVLLPDRQWAISPYLSWFPDSDWLAVVDAPGGGPSAIFRLSTRTGERIRLTFPPAGVLGDTAVAVSPDGRTVAFGRLRQLGEWSWSIKAVAIGDDLRPAGGVRSLTGESRAEPIGRELHGLAWSPDGRRIIYAGDSALWSLAVPDGTAPAPAPTRFDIGSPTYRPSIARESSRLVCSTSSGADIDVWRMRLPRAGRRTEAPVRLLSSTRLDFAPRYSPDGQRIAFESDRGGNLEIWVCDRDGGGCSALTSTGSQYTGLPAWSPDGTELAFYSRIGGQSQIFVIGSDGGAPRQLTADASAHMFPSWSRDGRSIYFASNRSGRYEVWRAPAAGGNALVVTRHGGFAASESPDGQWLYFTDGEALEARLFRMRLPDGEPSLVQPSIVLHSFELTSDGLYFVARAGTTRALRFLSATDGSTRTIGPLPEGYVGLSVSPDGQFLLYTATNPSVSNLSLVDGVL